ncbi:hypothetical protein LZZ90_13025 [Flavobacterium sp. SM15]|uniref:hypothetical protein n=1 Tax=Flavobacterium sp. SM15 TaxID=2908005 RepID=UPI001EDB1DA3|nr:hypothetical protein [Flavobacterium sp. SM15]MCG2612431.1 hypothetical protein [Flavobacterium sp. SM15]
MKTMGLFNKKEKKLIKEISRKNKNYHSDIEKEINELLHDLKAYFNENKLILEEFSTFTTKIKPLLSQEDAVKLDNYFKQVSKMKSCAKKSIEGLNYLSREQQKISKEALRDIEQYLT